MKRKPSSSSSSLTHPPPPLWPPSVPSATWKLLVGGNQLLLFHTFRCSSVSLGATFSALPPLGASAPPAGRQDETSALDKSSASVKNLFPSGGFSSQSSKSIIITLESLQLRQEFHDRCRCLIIQLASNDSLPSSFTSPLLQTERKREVDHNNPRNFISIHQPLDLISSQHFRDHHHHYYHHHRLTWFSAHQSSFIPAGDAITLDSQHQRVSRLRVDRRFIPSASKTRYQQQTNMAPPPPPPHDNI